MTNSATAAYEIKPPVYRYYTVDLLTDQILAEIPFSGVSYENAVKDAGSFSGKIPVLPVASNRSWNLYQSTMPGRTGVYVMRNGVCVWGGIIWSRQYNVVNRTLSVSASEFTSYLHHRVIWKTWSHQYGATVMVTGGKVDVVFDFGSSTTALKPGSTVKLDFYDPKDMGYNGYYRIAGSPIPTASAFSIAGANAVATIASVSRDLNTVTVNTQGNHGLSTGDTVTIAIDEFPELSGKFRIKAPAGSASTYFTYDLIGADMDFTEVVGEASRPLPDGVYEQVTVSVRADTYDYIRSLVNTVFNDFTGIDFPNDYIEPGLRYRLDVTNKQIASGYAELKTSAEHKASIGQQITISNAGPAFDGRVIVTSVPDDFTLRYRAGGAVPSTSVKGATATIVARSAANNIAIITTQTAHGYQVGQIVTVDSGRELDGQDALFNGEFTISEVSSPTSFSYPISSSVAIPKTTLSQPVVTSGTKSFPIAGRALTSNVATITTDGPHTLAVGNSVAVTGVDHVVKLIEKSLDSVASKATMRSDGAHNLNTGDQVNITGLTDSYALVGKTISGSGATKTVQLEADSPHSFRVGNLIGITGVVDRHLLASYTKSGSNAVVTLADPHNISAGSGFQIRDVKEDVGIAAVMVRDGSAQFWTSGTHRLAVNGKVTLSGVQEVATIISVGIVDRIMIFNTEEGHNFQPGMEVSVSGVGYPFDTGIYKDGTCPVLEVTPTRVLIELTDEMASRLNAFLNEEAAAQHISMNTVRSVIKIAVGGVAMRAARGSMTAAKSVYNKEWTVSSIPSPDSFTVAFDGNDQFADAVPDGARARGESQINGAYTASSVTATTITFPWSGPAGTVTVPAQGKDEPKPMLVAESKVNGVRTIVATGRKTFDFLMPLAQAEGVHTTDGAATRESIFNGSRTITVISADRFTFPLTGSNEDLLETAITTPAYARVTSVFNGTFTVTKIDTAANTFSFARSHSDLPALPTDGYGESVVQPRVEIGSYGPFPSNANLGIGFSTEEYSGVNVTPTLFRSFELKNVGEALSTYADNLDGFEYRIDCSYDAENDKFKRTFVLLPINLPNPPVEGEVSPLSRFGADKLIFEYPGSISDIQIDESAENTATRFFVTGDSDLGAEAGVPVSVSTDDDLLNGSVNGFRWPLLDAVEKADEIYDEDVLYAYAQRYLSEARPPDVSLSVSVNGSLPPEVGSYKAGDWCSLVVDDEFIRQRLATDMEPRDNVIVRKIDSIKVTVPDGSTFPEKVSLELVPEWDVDSFGKKK